MGNKSGYNASLTVGSYTGASLTDVTVTLSGQTIDVSDLSDIWRSKTYGLLDWELTGIKNVATEAFLELMKPAGGAAQTSVAVTVTNPAGTTVFSGLGWITHASLTYPRGAATEEITVVGNGTAPTVPA